VDSEAVALPGSDAADGRSPDGVARLERDARLVAVWAEEAQLDPGSRAGEDRNARRAVTQGGTERWRSA
jgi:hypothetical protein